MERVAAGRTVLVVDDSQISLTLATGILRREGFTCRTARNGLEALQACEASPPDLILLDIEMPLMDGIETCCRLKANPAWASIPVITLTAVDDPVVVRDMLEAGSPTCVTKPVDREGLMAALHVALEGRTP